MAKWYEGRTKWREVGLLLGAGAVALTIFFPPAGLVALGTGALIGVGLAVGIAVTFLTPIVISFIEKRVMRNTKPAASQDVIQNFEDFKPSVLDKGDVPKQPEFKELTEAQKALLQGKAPKVKAEAPQSQPVQQSQAELREQLEKTKAALQAMQEIETGVHSPSVDGNLTQSLESQYEQGTKQAEALRNANTAAIMADMEEPDVEPESNNFGFSKPKPVQIKEAPPPVIVHKNENEHGQAARLRELNTGNIQAQAQSGLSEKKTPGMLNQMKDSVKKIFGKNKAEVSTGGSANKTKLK